MKNPSMRRRSLLLGAAASTLSAMLPMRAESADIKLFVNPKPPGVVIGPPPVYNPAPDLVYWLGNNPNVAAAIQWQYSAWGAEFVISFDQWPQALKNNLITAYNNAYVGTPTNLPLVPANIAASASIGNPNNLTTVISTNDAQALYLAHVAHSLAVELRRDLPWSITAMSNAELQILFNSQKFFIWNSTYNGYECNPQAYLNWVLPAPPDYTYAFLAANGVINVGNKRPQPIRHISVVQAMTDAITNLLSWCGDNLLHSGGPMTITTLQQYWQYSGVPPAAQVIAGTVTTDPSLVAAGYKTARHWTFGCHGTSGFLQSVARTMNLAIDVPYFPTTGHQGPYVIGLGAYLSHGDDPYNSLGNFSSTLVGDALSFPKSELLINSATYNAWYADPNLTLTQINNNVGRRPVELAVQYLPLGLLYLYASRDINIPHANGQVFANLSNVYTLAQLEGMNLWQNMDAKIASLGGASAVYQIYNKAWTAAYGG